MGKNLSKINCMQANTGSRRKKKRSGSNRVQHVDDLIFVDKSGRVVEDLGPRTIDRGSLIRQDSLKLSNAVPANVKDPTKLDTILECDENSTKTTSAEYRGEKKLSRVALFAPDTSKRIGNSIELLTCPEISAIADVTDCQGRVSNVQPYKPFAMTFSPDGELTGITPLECTKYGDTSAVEISRSTLEAPPNSVNSQFISGVAPMDSQVEADYRPDTTRDSVFANDLSYVPEHCLDAMYYANFGAGRVLVNNNSLVLCQGSVKSDAKAAAVRNSVDLSSGPGLDSDFGASAGVEMRIVSSDFSVGVNNSRSPVTDREAASTRTTQSVPNRISGRLTASEVLPSSNRKSVSGLITRTMPVMQMVPAIGPDGCVTYAMVIRKRRAATVGGADDLLQATLEWDPYDMQYDWSHWQEYFIPGVTFPPQPVLCPREYWL